MKKDKIPEELAKDIAERATTNVQVGAVIVDERGHIVSWGWSSSGPDGEGQCAEIHAIKRANPKRLLYSTIYVYGQWNHSKNLVTSLPCGECMPIIKKRGIWVVRHITKGGSWRTVNL